MLTRRGNDLLPEARFTVSVLKDDAEFALLRSEWEWLFAQSQGQHFFHDYSWNWHSWTCVAAGQGERLRIIVGRLDERVVLIFPLIVRNRIARFLNSNTFAYRDMVLADAHRPEWFHSVWSALLALKEFDVLHLQNVRSPSRLEHLLTAVNPALWRVDNYSPTIRLRHYASWEIYAATRPRKLISDQRRQWRRIREAVPDLRCVLVTKQTDAESLILWMLAEKAGWAEDKGLAMGWSGGRGDVLIRVARDAFNAGRLLVFRLGSEEKTIAAGMGFVHDRQFTFELFAYDPAWENYSPSRLLLEHIITYCMDSGLDSFDFLPLPLQGGGLYKLLWAEDRINSTSYAIPISALGAARIRWRRVELSAIARYRAASWARAAAHRLLGTPVGTGLSDVSRMIRVRKKDESHEGSSR